MGVIRVWEEQARDAEEPLEWMNFPSVPPTTLEQAWKRVDWYGYRWLVEDYHQCLTSGYRMEERQGPRVDGLIRRLGSVVPSCRALVADPWRRAFRTTAPGEGWLSLQTFLEGAHLALHLRLEHVGKNQGSKPGVSGMTRHH